MNRVIIAAAALLAGGAIAYPMLGRSADNPQSSPAAAAGGQSSAIIPPLAQGAAPTQGTAAAGDAAGAGLTGRPGMEPMGDRMGMGRMAAGPMDENRWRWQRMMMMHRMPPRQRCEERLARRAGVVAYTIAKLNLTEQQRPLWGKVQDALQAAGDKQRQLCASLKPREESRNETVLDRMQRREQFLSAHLQALQQVEPAMQQFYQALTPDQQAIINHPFRRD